MNLNLVRMALAAALSGLLLPPAALGRHGGEQDADRETRDVREVKAPKEAKPVKDAAHDSRVRDSSSDQTKTDKPETARESDGEGRALSESDLRKIAREIEEGKVEQSVSGSGDEGKESSGSNSGSGSSGSGSGDDSSGSNSGSGSSGSGSGDDSSGSNSGSGSSGSGSGDDSSGSNSGSGSSGSEDGTGGSMRTLAHGERPEFDPRGYPVRRGEIIALAPSATALTRLKAQGFRTLQSRTLGSIGMPLVRLRAPKGQDADTALQSAKLLDPAGLYDYDHYYAAAAGDTAATGPNSAGSTAKPPAPKSIDARIGVIDTGIVAHPLLKKAHIEARDFSQLTQKGSGTEQGQVNNDHGLAVASVLIGQGVRRIVSANVFRGLDQQPYTEASAIAAALNWMAERQVAVINISIAGPSNALLDRIVTLISLRGHVIVAAAGNAGPTAPPAYPAASQGAIAVTAVDGNGRVYRYANRGRFIRYAARGVDVQTATAGGGTVLRSGTSFAAPVVSALFAGCLGKAGRTQVVQCLDKYDRAAIDLGEPGRDAVYGNGLLKP